MSMHVLCVEAFSCKKSFCFVSLPRTSPTHPVKQKWCCQRSVPLVAAVWHKSVRRASVLSSSNCKHSLCPPPHPPKKKRNRVTFCNNSNGNANGMNSATKPANDPAISSVLATDDHLNHVRVILPLISSTITHTHKSIGICYNFLTWLEIEVSACSM